MDNNESKVWEKHHTNPSTTNFTKNLYSDDSPCTTIKGIGFKDSQAAKLSLALSGQPGCRYKQYWTIRAMHERAKYHPSQTPGMREAMDIYYEWMQKREKKQNPTETNDGCENESYEIEQEMIQRKLLVDSKANAHARCFYKTNEDFKKVTDEDKKKSLSLMLNVAAMFTKDVRSRNESKDLQEKGEYTEGSDSAIKRGLRFEFPITLFANIFGAPGNHGYGSHVCIDAQKAGLPAFRCICQPECFSGKHHITVKSLIHVCDGLLVRAKNRIKFPYEEFEMTFMGSDTEIAYFIGKLDKNQKTLKDFFHVQNHHNKRHKT